MMPSANGIQNSGQKPSHPRLCDTLVIEYSPLVVAEAFNPSDNTPIEANHTKIGEVVRSVQMRTEIGLATSLQRGGS